MSESKTLDKDGVRINEDDSKVIRTRELLPTRREVTKQDVDNFVKAFSAKQQAIAKVNEELEREEAKKQKKGKNDNNTSSNKE